MAACSQVVVGSGEASDRAVDDGAGSERGRGRPGARLEREPGIQVAAEFQRGELIESYPALLPVRIAAVSESKSEVADQRRETPASSSGAIHIEPPGRAVISVECGADVALLRSILESLRK